MRFDLHCHTLHSDGDKSVKELFKLAQQAGLQGLSITDHDTINAYDEAFDIIDDYHLKIVSGVEVSCLHHQKPVHVLVYAFSVKDKSFQAFIKDCQLKRLDRNEKMIKKLQQHHLDISQAELEERYQKELSLIGRPHFAGLLVEKQVVKSFQEAFNRYLGDRKPCYVAGVRPSVEEALEAAAKANALAVLAHPHLIQDSALERELLELPFDGIEAYYAIMPPQKERRWVVEGQKRDLLLTGGSDFHGDIKPINRLGSSWVDQEVFEILYQRAQFNDRR